MKSKPNRPLELPADDGNVGAGGMAMGVSRVAWVGLQATTTTTQLHFFLPQLCSIDLESKGLEKASLHQLPSIASIV